MKSIRNKSNAVGVEILLAMGLYLLVVFPYDSEGVYQLNYCVDAIGLLIVVGVLAIQLSSGRMSLFEPILFCSVIYGALFFFMPMYDICNGTTTWFGYDFFAYGVEATLYAIFGYIAFVVMYYQAARSGSSCKSVLYCCGKYTALACVVLYCVSFAANLYYLTHTTGNSISYVLSFGLIGSSGGDKIETSIGFVGMLSYCLPATTLLYMAYGRCKPLKIIFVVLMIMVQMANGFRFIIVETAFMLVSFVCLTKGLRLTPTKIILVVVALLVPVMLMTIFRESVRGGTGVDLSVVELSSLGDVFDDAIFDNLRIYNNYYGLIPVIPSSYPYQYLDMIVVYTIRMIIPSAIWPNKYEGFVSPGIESYYGGAFTGTGQAYPNLGEFYASFGFLGILVFMSLFGWLMGKLEKRCGGSKDSTLLAIYAVTVGNCLQIIIRGYTPSNFYLVLFSVVPVFLIRLISMKKDSTYNKEESD